MEAAWGGVVLGHGEKTSGTQVDVFIDRGGRMSAVPDGQLLGLSAISKGVASLQRG